MCYTNEKPKKDDFPLPYEETTIAALASAPGAAGVAVVRVSGPQALPVLRRCFSRQEFAPRHLYYGTVKNGSHVADHGLAVYFPAPHSYTGEDCAEVHCHGGAQPVRAVLEALFAAGAVPAQPGEFTKRAFLNGRLDLSQAEAVMDVIGAQAEGARRLALHQLEGRLGRRVTALQDELLALLAEIEVTVDYPEEDLEVPTATAALRKLEGIAGSLGELLATAHTGQTLREGVRCAIVGRPNAGKSSLLNALLGAERAIVTAQPGTTRDTLDASASIGGLAVTFVDTAGIREAGDEVERLGVERARSAMASAALCLLVVDGSAGVTGEDRDIRAALGEVPAILVWNKADLPAAMALEQAQAELCCTDAVAVSARTGEGIAALEAAILRLCGADQAAAESAVLSNQRHIHSAHQALTALQDAIAALRMGFPPDTAAVDIRAGWHALGQITGRTADEDVIVLIFSRFCLGK